MGTLTDHQRLVLSRLAQGWKGYGRSPGEHHTVSYLELNDGHGERVYVPWLTVVRLMRLGLLTIGIWVPDGRTANCEVRLTRAAKQVTAGW